MARLTFTLAMLCALVLSGAVARGQDIGPYTATADVLPIGMDPDDPKAEIFFVAYTLDQADAARRPITFLFNGGPGAASVFLHLGAVGPYTLAVAGDGSMPAPPSHLVANPYSWLAFTDLVFIDPVGTGYSRALPSAHGDDDGGGAGANGPADPHAYWDAEADLQAIGQFMRLYLTRNDRWASPKVIAGESYGGLRVGALTRMLMDDFDILLNGAVLVSPVLDYSLVEDDSRHSLLPWATLLPSLAATAAVHGRAARGDGTADPVPDLAEVEAFALTGYLTGLAGIGRMPEAETAAFYARVAGLTGLDVDTVARMRGRIGAWDFAKLLLRDRQLVVDRYDGTQAGPDPYPDRPWLEGDRSLTLSDGLFASAFLGYVADELGYRTDRPYEVLNDDTFYGWTFDSAIEGRQGYVRTADDLAYALTLNDRLQVLIVHGLHDLITPYLASRYLIDQTVVDPDARSRVRFANYDGGHMFYFHSASLQAFHDDVAALFAGLAGPSDGRALPASP
ncbi:MAG: peptidase S10 [Rhodospirillaceae bacterium]|nr:peptidase S10 [Rhodospirillaceae bacterium]